MWVPSNIQEWIDERISFCEKMLSSVVEGQAKTDFVFALQDYRYCRKLYYMLIENPEDTENKKSFRAIAESLLLAQMETIDRQENRAINIHGVSFVTTEKSKLPQEVVDNNAKLSEAFKKIYERVLSITTA